MTQQWTYPDTHPWLRFGFRGDLIQPNTWVLLGEARSKIEHLSQVPLKPGTSEQMHRIYLAKGALASAAIEGNTLTEEQALAIAEDKSELPPSQEYLEQEVANIMGAANWVMANLDDVTPPLSPETIRDFNSRVLEGLKLQPEVVPGEYREFPIDVGNVYRGPRADECEHLMDRLCTWLDGETFVSPDPDNKIVVAILRSILAHLYIAWIHPFGDGNGRTARLTEFLILASAGVPTPAAHLLSNHYNQTRDEYYRQLRAASQNDDIASFIAYAVRGFVDQLREQLTYVFAQVVLDSWQTYVHEVLPGHSKPATRQRSLVLAASHAGIEGRSRQELTEVTPEIAALYAPLSGKTLTRDLIALQRSGLLVVDEDGLFWPNIQVLTRFLPKRAG